MSSLPQLRVGVAVMSGMSVISAAASPIFLPGPGIDPDTAIGYELVDEYLLSRQMITADGTATATHKSVIGEETLTTIGLLWNQSTVTPLALEENRVESKVYGLNASKTVVGRVEVYVDQNFVGNQAAKWLSDGTRVDLPTLGMSSTGAFFGSAYDIDSAGNAGGASRKYVSGVGKGVRPVKWTPQGNVIELPIAVDANGNATGVVNSMSPGGQATGYTGPGLDNSTSRAARWDPSNALISLSATVNSNTFGQTQGLVVNDNGYVAGIARTTVGSQNIFGVLWAPDGTGIELQNIPNSLSRNQFPRAVNSSNVVAGWAVERTPDMIREQAALWRPDGQLVRLPYLPESEENASSIAVDLNDLGFAVGQVMIGEDLVYQRAVVWTPDNQVIDLNSLLQSNVEWSLENVYTITNTGWITGQAFFLQIGAKLEYRRSFSMLLPFAGTYGLGDANFDESIDFNDLLIIAQNYGTSTNGSLDAGDFNLDGVVDFNDLLVIAQNYGTHPTSLSGEPGLNFTSDWARARTMVPEPAILSLAGLSSVLLARRSRSRLCR